MGRIVTLGVALALGLAACTPPIPDSPTPDEKRALADEACPAVTGTFLFEIEKDGQRSHMLGTRHVGVALRKFPAYVRDRFRTSSVLVVESLHQPDRPPPPPARTVVDELDEQEWRAYRDLVGPQVAAHVAERSVAAAVAGIVLLYEDLGQVLDVELQGDARAAGMDVVALEDVAQSAAIEGRLMGANNLRSLLAAVRRRSQVKASTRHDLALYCRGQVQPGVAYSAEQAQITAQSMRERNAAWLDALVPLLARGGAFIAVGRGHITDDGNLRTLLRDRGYRVEQVTR